MNNKPKTIEITSIGCPFPYGGMNTLILKEDCLEYMAGEEIVENIDINTVTQEQWDTFRATLDSIGVWEWDKSYSPSMRICDGYQWGVKIAYDDIAIESSGSNAYPENNALNELFKAVEKLINGLEFF